MSIINIEKIKYDYKINFINSIANNNIYIYIIIINMKTNTN